MRADNQSLPESEENSRAAKNDSPAGETIDKDKPEVDRSVYEFNLAHEIDPLNPVDKEIDESLPSTSAVLGGQEVPLRPSEPAVNVTRSRKRTRAGRYSSDITYQELAQYFHLPSTEACREIGLGLTAFKKVCRKFGLAMWPYKRPTKGRPMVLPKHHPDPADPREKKRDTKAVTMEDNRQSQLIPDVRLNFDTVQHGLKAKPDTWPQVEHLQAQGSDQNEQGEAVPPGRSELTMDMIKQLLEYRQRRNASHNPGSLMREQPRQDFMGKSRMYQDNMMMAASKSEHDHAMLPTTTEVVPDLDNQKIRMNKDIRAKSLDLSDIIKFNQIVYLWKVLLLLDSIQDDCDDAS